MNSLKRFVGILCKLNSETAEKATEMQSFESRKLFKVLLSKVHGGLIFIQMLQTFSRKCT